MKPVQKAKKKESLLRHRYKKQIRNKGAEG